MPETRCHDGGRAKGQGNASRADNDPQRNPAKAWDRGGELGPRGGFRSHRCTQAGPTPRGPGGGPLQVRDGGGGEKGPRPCAEGRRLKEILDTRFFVELFFSADARVLERARGKLHDLRRRREGGLPP